MDIYLNILIIILAIIGFLIFYYYASRREEERDHRLPLNDLDLEVGRDIGIDEKRLGVEPEEMYNIGQEENYDSPKKREEFTEHLERIIKDYQLQERYGEDFIRLLAKDPNYLFAYWEINDQSFFQNKPYLRLFNEKEDKYSDIEINHDTLSWYLHASANTRYSVAIGYKKEGVFYPLAHSNNITTPLEKPSNVIDEHWMTIEELSRYSYRIEMDTLAMIKNIEERKLAEELKADSLTLIEKK